MSYENPLLDESKIPNPKNYNKIIDEKILNKFEELAMLNFSGLSYTSLDDEFKDKFNSDFSNLILFRATIDSEILKLEPSESKHKLIDEDFRALGSALYECSDFLRANGFATEIVNPIHKNMDLRICIEKSNAGVRGRSRVCIFPEGPNVVLFAILTSIGNLPIIEINKHLWVKDFCSTCGKCIRKCPEHAYGENENFIKKACIGYKKGCGLCMLNCPFFIKGYKRIKEIYLKRQSHLK